MKTFLLLLISIISLPLFKGCSDNSSIIPDYGSPCSEVEEDILCLPGSPYAPVLYTNFDIESEYLFWTEIEGAYYEVEECDCPCFTSIIYNYYIYDNTILHVIKYNYFYRVRAYTGSGLTGWSNVVICSHKARL